MLQTKSSYPWKLVLLLALAFCGASLLHTIATAKGKFGHKDAAHQLSAADIAKDATYRARDKALEVVGTPAAFQRKCGRAADSSVNPADGSVLLIYRRSGRGVLFIFTPVLAQKDRATLSYAKFYTDDGAQVFPDTDEKPGIYDALDEIGCKIR